MYTSVQSAVLPCASVLPPLDTAPHLRVAVVNATLPSLLCFGKGSELRLRVRVRTVYWVLTGCRWGRTTQRRLRPTTGHPQPGQLEVYPSGLLTPGANTLFDRIAFAGIVLGRVSVKS